MAARVLMGRIGRPHGVQGLVHLVSFTDPPEAIFGYPGLADEAGTRLGLSRAGRGEALLARIDGVRDRDGAARLANAPIYADRAAMAAPAAEEFYHADLLDLAVLDEGGHPLGRVAAIHDHGAGAILEIAGADASLLLPFTRRAVPLVDLAGGRIVVALPAEIVVPPSGAEDAA